MALKNFLRNKFFWIFILMIVGIWRISSGYFSKAVERLTQSKVRNYAERIIALNVEKNILNDLDGTKIFIENIDSNGKVAYAYVDSLKVNEIRNNVVLYMDTVISQINEHEGLDSISIPIGYFLGIKYYLVDGIKVPLKLEVIGNQNIQIKSDTISKGINTTIMEIYLDVSLEIQVMIPFQKNTEVINTKIPLAIEIMNNEIPIFLNGIE